MSLVRLALFGLPDRRRVDEIRLHAPIPTEATEFDVVVFDDDRGLLAKLAEAQPHVIVSFGDIEWYRELVAAPMWVRKRWLHVTDAEAPLDELAESAMFTFAANVVADRFPQAPLVSVFTCAYRSGDRLLRAYQSLVTQSYGDWEWVVYDDSDDDGETFRLISELAAKDPRIVAARGTGNCGRIGEVKRRACGLTRGS